MIKYSQEDISYIRKKSLAYRGVLIIINLAKKANTRYSGAFTVQWVIDGRLQESECLGLSVKPLSQITLNTSLLNTTRRVNHLMKPYTNTAELIATFESEIKTLTDNITTLKSEPQSINEQILLKYIDTASTGKTKDFVRSLDIKSERGSFFSSGDVSKLIKNGAEDISPNLLAIARTVVSMKNKNGKHR